MLVAAATLMATLVAPQGAPQPTDATTPACLEASIAHLDPSDDWRVERVQELHVAPQSSAWAMVELVRNTDYRFVACSADGTIPIEVVLYNNRTEHLRPSGIRGQHSHMDYAAGYTAPFFVGVRSGVGAEERPQEVVLLVVER